MNIRSHSLVIAAGCAALFLSGCCITSLTCRKACQQPSNNCLQAYEAFPQGADPLGAPQELESAPEPFVPPAPVSGRLDRSKGGLSESQGHSI